MAVNANIVPRPLTDEELAARRKGEYDSFANYLVFCPKCGDMAKTNMYVMRAEAYISELGDRPCPACGAQVRRSCPACGHAAEDGWKVCPYCGRELPKRAEEGRSAP